MSRGPQAFKQRDITRAMKAAKAAGFTTFRVEVTKDGRLVVVVAETDKPTTVEINSWEKVVADLEKIT
jgi:hypothetical protein